VKSYQPMLRRFDGLGPRPLLPHGLALGPGGRRADAKGYLAHLWSDQIDAREHLLRRDASLPPAAVADGRPHDDGPQRRGPRNPFLDYRLVEFAFTLDDSLRYRDGTGKWIVKAAAQRLFPKDSLVLQRNVKHGLPTPINLWLQGQASFDRKYWTSMMTAECIKNLQRGSPLKS
jgi:hypothetical protein